MSNRGRHKKSNQHLIIQILGIKIANRMMECQKEQGNIPSLNIFLQRWNAPKYNGGFSWGSTIEGFHYWHTVMSKIANHPLYKQYKNDRS